VQNYPIKSCAVVSHIRQANRGAVALENTHPFTRELWGRNWTFAHNGQLKGYRRLKTGHFRPVGETDSEYAFCWLLYQLAGGVSLYRHAGGSTAQKGRVQHAAVGWAVRDGVQLDQTALDYPAGTVWQGDFVG